MDLGSICLCLVVGALIVFASIGIGVCYGRNDNRDNQRQSDGDSDVRTYVYRRDRDRSRNNRCHISMDEKIMVLRNIRRLTHGWEREVIDSIEEDVKNVRKMDNKRERTSQD